MTRKNTLAFTIALLLCALPAAAGNWDGWYVGGNLSAGDGEAETMTGLVADGSYFAGSSVTSINADGAPQDLDFDGVSPGIQGGINFEPGGWFVWGIELDVNATDADETVSVTTVYPCCAPTDYTLTQGYETGLAASLRARAGWANAKVFLYVTAGLAAMEIETAQTFSDTFASAAQANSEDSTETAPVYGIGGEFKVGGGPWSIKVELLQADFDEIVTSSGMTAPVGAEGNIFTHTLELETGTARVGANFRF